MTSTPAAAITDGWMRWLPGLQTLRQYEVTWLPHDLMATALLLHPRLRDAVPLTMESKKGACMFVHNYILQTQQSSPDCEKIANAVLYEGYLLYPYRASAIKNQQRFNFGVLYPPAYCKLNADEASAMQTECLVAGDRNVSVEVKVRFLQMVEREGRQEGGFGSTGVEAACPDPRLARNS